METIREYPNAAFDFLRCQVGRMERRMAMEPVYDGESGPLMGLAPSGEFVTTFHLFGWGENLKEARAMAEKSYPKEKKVHVIPPAASLQEMMANVV